MLGTLPKVTQPVRSNGETDEETLGFRNQGLSPTLPAVSHDLPLLGDSSAQDLVSTAETLFRLNHLNWSPEETDAQWHPKG